MVSIFKNFNEVVEQKAITSILEEIKTGKYKNPITYLRGKSTQIDPLK